MIAPPPHLEYFSFGYQSAIADSLWVRAIQDFDYCEVKIAENICKGNSWLFHMLDSITELDPRFIEPFREGAVALSVLITDVPGASKLFDKGVLMHPNDFPLAYRAAYHYLYEEKDKEKAAKQFLKAARILGPQGDWLYSLSVRLYTDAGQKELALKLYEQFKSEGMQEGMLERMRQKLGLPQENGPGQNQ